MNKNRWQDKRVLILGAARQGLALARFLCQRGARVTLNDQRNAEKLTAEQAAMAGYTLQWALGGHPVELLEQVDLVCLSGGIPLTLPIVQTAVERGLPVSNDSQVFMEEVPCRVIGITGSAGKTTTTTLVGRMAAAAQPGHSWVGGNIGLPLVEYLDKIQPEDTVVLELSSFQLEQMTRSPQIAAVLNITPNHLDRHGTMAAYSAAKANILRYQTPADTAVLGRDDRGAWELRDLVKGHLLSFGLNGGQDTLIDQGWISINGTKLLPLSAIGLRGEHNLRNVLAACAIGTAAGFAAETLRAAVEGFGGVPHRLALVRTLHGVRWYNDSIATAPERTSAAIRAFDEPLVLLLGGRDKNLPWADLAELVCQRVDHVVVFGEAADKILAALGSVSSDRRPQSTIRCTTLHQAVQAAAEAASEGDVVLLSPGGTSFDEFKDFEERGERFRTWVNQLS